jgi:hypothetical protein
MEEPAGTFVNWLNLIETQKEKIIISSKKFSLNKSGFKFSFSEKLGTADHFYFGKKKLE